MERRYFKAINFDLDTHQLEKKYPGVHYRKAYEDLKLFFKQHDFLHRQGSGYVSEVKMSTADIYDLMDDLSSTFIWLSDCVNKIDVTNIGAQHDLKELLTPIEGNVLLDPVA